MDLCEFHYPEWCWAVKYGANHAQRRMLARPVRKQKKPCNT